MLESLVAYVGENPEFVMLLCFTALFLLVLPFLADCLEPAESRSLAAWRKAAELMNLECFGLTLRDVSMEGTYRGFQIEVVSQYEALLFSGTDHGESSFIEIHLALSSAWGTFGRVLKKKPDTIKGRSAPPRVRTLSPTLVTNELDVDSQADPLMKRVFANEELLKSLALMSINSKNLKVASGKICVEKVQHINHPTALIALVDDVVTLARQLEDHVEATRQELGLPPSPKSNFAETTTQTVESVYDWLD